MSEARKLSESEERRWQALAGGFNSLTANSSDVPLIERYCLESLVPDALLDEYRQQRRGIFGRTAAESRDIASDTTVRLPAGVHLPAGALVPGLAPPAQAAPPTRETPQRVEPGTYQSDNIGTGRHRKPQRSLGEIVGRAASAVHRRRKTVAAGTLMLIAATGAWMGASSADNSGAVPRGDVTAVDSPRLALKRAVLQSTEAQRETATCAAEDDAMADYIDRQESRGIDMSHNYPSAVEYRTAAQRARELATPIACAPAAGQLAQAAIEGQIITGQEMAGFKFDVRMLCDPATRSDAEQEVAAYTTGQQFQDHMARLDILLTDVQAACPVE